MQRRRQHGHLGHAGVGDRHCRRGPQPRRNFPFRRAGGEQRDVDSTLRQYSAQIRCRNGVRFAVVALQQYRAVSVQGYAVEVGDMVAVRVAFQQILQGGPRCRTGMVQSRLQVQALQRGHSVRCQASARHCRVRQQRAGNRNRAVQRAGGQHQRVHRVLRPCFGIARGYCGRRLPQNARQRVDKVSQIRVVHQFPGQRLELRPGGDNYQLRPRVPRHHVVKQRPRRPAGREGHLKQQSAQIPHCLLYRFHPRQGADSWPVVFPVIPVQRRPLVIRQFQRK